MTSPVPPDAPRRPHTRTVHGMSVDDPWYWLRERDDPAVVAYLEAENAYTEAVTADDAGLREALFEEIRARIEEDDESVPVRKGAWWYSSRTAEGAQYGMHVRRSDDGGRPGDDEHVYLDENRLAEGHDYFRVGDMAASPSGDLLAYSTDTAGDERYDLEVLDLRTDEPTGDRITGVTYGVAWSAAGDQLFYTVPDESWRPYRVMRHRLGTDPATDAIVYEEPDERFWVGLGSTRSDAYVVIGTESKTTSEYRVIDAAAPTGEPVVIEARRTGIEYRIEHHGDSFLVLTNDGAPNFRLMTTPVDAPGREHWTELVPEPADGRLDDIDAFAGHLVVTARRSAVPVITVIDTATGERRDLDFPEDVYEAAPGGNPEYETATLRFGYTSLVTPSSVYDEDMATGRRELRKQQPVLGGYDPTRYDTARGWATAADGTEIPISVVWNRGLVARGTPAPCLLYGYGSYEMVTPAAFSSARLNLLDRGVVFAIAHIRGGGEMGRSWYELGKFEHKQNTFGDFVACAEALIGDGWTSPDLLAARGGSAGGLLVGAVVNQRPDLFTAAVAEVPFVDNVNTMLDPTIPLTVTEYEEWGDPGDRALFDAMVAYSPYENVTAQDYPAMLVTAGLNDPRVQYWEPAKWVAKLRATKTDGNVLLLKTEMGAGHGGPSGRYDAWRDEAFVHAFLLRRWRLV